MSKSTKNYVVVDEVLSDYAPQVFRLFFCAAHYRSQVDYDPEGLEEAKRVWERFRSFLRVAPQADVDEQAVAQRLEHFGEAMDDDLNTPAALAVLHEIVREGHSAVERGEDAIAAAARAAVVRGLNLLGCSEMLDEPARADRDRVRPLVELLLAQREEARRAKDFQRADTIRARLAEIGIRVEDSAEGPRWFLE